MRQPHQMFGVTSGHRPGMIRHGTASFWAITTALSDLIRFFTDEINQSGEPVRRCRNIWYSITYICEPVYSFLKKMYVAEQTR